ncbi:MAG: hypothetical protein KME26_07955 [Oscillatoria princeps RMCB-10]|jgi:hypothetical protein|nr:hypothetical protein [Oscillatoria princeps RMCB-10]
MRQIIYPSLDLFVYQLAEGLGADDDKITADRQAFLANLAGVPPKKLKEVEETLAQEKPDPLEDVDFPEIITEDKYRAGGYYTPVRLSDTYGLLFAASVEDSDPLKEQPVSSFKALKSLAKTKQGNLGTTCILYGYLPKGEDSATLAEDILTQFLDGEPVKLEWQDLTWDWDKKQAQPAKFLGADVFFFLPETGDSQNLAAGGIFIILYPQPDENHTILNTYADLHRPWIELFWFQNKILWAYEQAKQIKELLKQDFIKVSETFRQIKNPELELPQLQEILEKKSQTVAGYAINLNYLEIQLRTIKINLRNFDLCAEYLEKQAQKICPSETTNLKSLLDKFSQIAREQYQKQVRQDIDSLKPGLEALEKVISAVNSLHALKQAERDRRLEHLIQSVGAGVGTASVAATVSSALIKDFTPLYPKIDKNKLPWAEPVSNLVIVLLLSLVSGWLSYKGLWKYLHRHPSK